MPCETAEIAEQIGAFLACGKKNFWTYFLPNRTLKNFGPIPWQAAEINGGLLATESQTPKGTHFVMMLQGWMMS